MRLSIAHNPHSESPRDLFDQLSPPKKDYLEADLDRAGMEALKAAFNKTG